MTLSWKQALAFCVLAISSFAGWLYVVSFAGILLFVYRTGGVVIKADSLLPAESFLLLGVSFCLALIALYSVMAIASQLRKGEPGKI